MIDLKSKLKRQIEILGVCLSQHYSGHISTFDLAEIFSVEELTVKRDLQSLRKAGVFIHSVKGKGVILFKRLKAEILKDLLKQYVSVNEKINYYEKSTNLLITKHGEKSLANMVSLQMCIEQNKIAYIDYQKENYELEFRIEIHPLMIFDRDNYWRVLAINNGTIKQYHLNKIFDVRISEKHFVPLSPIEIENVFKHSFRSWIGSEKYKVKLLFSKFWIDKIKPKQLLEEEQFIENPDGTIFYEATVNSLDEFAGWIVSRGDGIKVLEPDELKEKVINLARAALKNYD